MRKPDIIRIWFDDKEGTAQVAFSKKRNRLTTYEVEEWHQGMTLTRLKYL
jgi:hypothetical protein